MNIGLTVLIIIVLLALILVKKSLIIIPQSETKIVERLGKYYATLQPASTSSSPSLTVPRNSSRSIADVMCIPIPSISANRSMTSTSRM